MMPLEKPSFTMRFRTLIDTMYGKGDRSPAAFELGLSPSQVSRWYSGATQTPRLHVTFDLARRAGVPPGWFIGEGDDDLAKVAKKPFFVRLGEERVQLPLGLGLRYEAQARTLALETVRWSFPGKPLEYEAARLRSLKMLTAAWENVHDLRIVHRINSYSHSDALHRFQAMLDANARVYPRLCAPRRHAGKEAAMVSMISGADETDADLAKTPERRRKKNG